MSAQIPANSLADLNKTRAAFMERASAPHIPPHALKLAYLIAFKYMNRQSRTARPAQGTLARDLNVSVRTVQRLLDLLQPVGLVVVPGDGRGKASTYWIDPERVTPVSSFSARKGDKKGRQETPKKGDTGVAPTLLKRTKILAGECYALPQPEGERDRASRDDSSADPGRAALRAAAGSEDPHGIAARASSRRQSGHPSEEEVAADAQADPPSEAAAENPAPVAALEHDAAWGTLRELWRRGWASDDTPKALAIGRQAFERACREGVDPGEIIEAAKTWIAAADAPRFLPPLPQWLAAQGWEKPPPTKRERANGGPHGKPQRGDGRAANEFFEIAGYVKDADGHLVRGGVQ